VSIRNQIPQEVFDYQTLLCTLDQYGSPRDKITRLLKQGTIIRIKKGLYIFAKDARQRPFSREVLANLIYGPSYISLEYGLQHYGLIPERVETVTSVTIGRGRKFSTPAGEFTFRQIPVQAFSAGMDLQKTEAGQSYLIAVPEKTLVDKLQSDCGLSIRSLKDMHRYLEEDLRLDVAECKQMDAGRIQEYGARYHSRKATLLADAVKQFQGL
jgi:predicted transcriptional regulator of viral defense system